MKRYMLMVIVVPTSLFCMEKPTEQISKADLIKLIEHHDAKNVLHALSHQQAEKVIDEDVANKAHEMHKHSAQNTARAASILLMITKKNSLSVQPSLELSHSATQNKEAAPKEKTRIPSLKPHSKHHHSSQKIHEASPKTQLKHLIKKRDVEAITQFMGTSGVHFIDTEIVAYAQKKYDLLGTLEPKTDVSTSKEYEILQLIKKNGPQPSKERRKSCMIKPNAAKEKP